MLPNLIPALLLGTSTFLLFRHLYLRAPAVAARATLAMAALAMAAPATLFASNYALLVPYAGWFRELRAMPGAEISSGFVGAILGTLYASSRLRPGPLNRAVLMMCTALSLGLLIAPFGKQIFFRVDYFGTLKNRWEDGTCLQTTGYTCVPASIATLARVHGGHLTEPTLARAAGTTVEGTEVWYLERALREQGFEPAITQIRSLRQAPAPCVIGVGWGERGHAIAILHRDAKGVIIGDPATGRREFKWSDVPNRYKPNGLCITIRVKKESREEAYDVR